MLFEQSAIKVIVMNDTTQVVFFKNTAKSGIILLLGDYLPADKNIQGYKWTHSMSFYPTDRFLDTRFVLSAILRCLVVINYD